jgi:hypothetical protein
VLWYAKIPSGGSQRNATLLYTLVARLVRPEHDVLNLADSKGIRAGAPDKQLELATQRTARTWLVS